MSQDAQAVIAGYLTDMIALEEHLQGALAGQLADLKRQRFASLIRALNTTSEAHVQALRALAKDREQGGQGIAEVVKKATSSVLGFGAAAIAFVRGDERTPKDLRDDHAVVSLASVGYLMLHTTARALQDAEVADVAFAHLRDYATASTSLFNVLPDAVVDFLAEEGFPVQDGVAARVNAAVDTIWAAGASQHA